jgi:hypothetical protein
MCKCVMMLCRYPFALPESGPCPTSLLCLQGILNVDDDVEEEFEIDINEAEPAFLKGQSSRSGVEVCRVHEGLSTRLSSTLQLAQL